MVVDTRILDRIQKLLALSGSPNANEAENAYAAAQKLLTEHRLTMAEVAAANNKPTAQINNKRIHQSGQRFTRWMNYLFNGLCRLNQCRMIELSQPLTYHVFGSDQDIAIVEYMYNSIRVQTELLCMQAMQTEGGFGKSWATNFKFGVIDRVLERLTDVNQQVMSKQDKNSTAMVLLRNQSIEVADQVKKVYPKLIKPQTVFRSNPDARECGQAAGDRVTFHKGLARSDRKLLR